MTLQRTPVILTILNLVILAWLLAGPLQAGAQGGPGILRGTALQIVDSQGRVRASLGILPAEGAAADETVLLRLINAAGQPSLKIGVSETSAAMSLTGGDDESYVLVAAEGPSSTMKLVGPNGLTKTIAP